LSATAEPTTSMPPTTAGGDVTSYSANSPGALRRPRRRSTMPPSPKPGHVAPSPASSAISRASMVAMNTRARQRAPRAAPESVQSATPRFVKSPKLLVRATPGLKRQRSRPVAASSAKTRPSGVLRYMVPPTTSGVASNDVRRRVS
jgi:hypothetical protein